MSCFEVSAESNLSSAPSNQPITLQAFIFINRKSFHRKILKYLFRPILIIKNLRIGELKLGEGENGDE
jgi:hypothetical protein